MDDDTLSEIEFQLIYGHSYPCALDTYNLTAVWYDRRLWKRPFPTHNDRWLYGRRFMQRSWTMGQRDGKTLIAVMLN